MKRYLLPAATALRGASSAPSHRPGDAMVPRIMIHGLSGDLGHPPVGIDRLAVVSMASIAAAISGIGVAILNEAAKGMIVV